MKAHLIIAVVLALLLVVFAQNQHNEDTVSAVHRVQKRQIVKPVQITVRPTNGCVFFECIPSCKRRGYPRGGICTINGCQCLK